MIQDLSKTILAAALAHKGTAEWPGAAHNPQVLDYFRKAGQPMPDDETPWCAAFVGAVLAECGLQGTGSLAARSYLKWGQEVTLDDARPGDVVVFWRGSKDGWQGHVAWRFSTTSGREKYTSLAAIRAIKSASQDTRPTASSVFAGPRHPARPKRPPPRSRPAPCSSPPSRRSRHRSRSRGRCPRRLYSSRAEA